MDIWQACGARALPAPLTGTLLRIVESQHDVATLALVSTLAEQAELERLLERSKPSLPPETDGLHYLLATPFRYPPLRHGSRFGARFEPALLYGSKRRATVLAEAAYYRFLFWYGMQAPPPGRLVTTHCLFSARYRTAFGLALHAPPFDTYRAELTSPNNYRATQRLGTRMRAAGVAAFEFASARDRAGGLNVALFTPRALTSRRPSNPTNWLCETDAALVTFAQAGGRIVQAFPLQEFLVDGALPVPAA
jgi:RES domain